MQLIDWIEIKIAISISNDRAQEKNTDRFNSVNHSHGTDENVRKFCYTTTIKDQRILKAGLVSGSSFQQQEQENHTKE